MNGFNYKKHDCRSLPYHLPHHRHVPTPVDVPTSPHHHDGGRSNQHTPPKSSRTAPSPHKKTKPRVRAVTQTSRNSGGEPGKRVPDISFTAGQGVFHRLILHVRTDHFSQRQHNTVMFSCGAASVRNGDE